MIRTALYAGSFDPVTNGHLDVIRQACRLVQHLVIAIGVHPGKAPMFSPEERADLLRATCAPLAEAEGASLDIVTFDDLAVSAARRSGASIFIRGLRDGTDLDYEMQLAGMNGAMAPEVQTVFPARLHRRPADHRHPGAPDRGHGRRCLALRSSPRGGTARRALHASLIPSIPLFQRTGDRPLMTHRTLHRRTAFLSLALAAMIGFAPVARAADDNTVYLDTKDGRVTIELRPDLAPQHVAQLKTLIKKGFYDGLKFHRVMDGFMAQTGDPKGNGTGGSSLPNIPAEFSQSPFRRGTLGMARSSDPNSANSQFFICLGDAPFLNGQYTVIGLVSSGMDVVDKIKKAAAGAPGGAVQNPDKIVKMQMAQGAK